MSFRDIALPLSALGIPVTPVQANSKAAFLPDWPTSATTDVAQIEAWDRVYGNINGAAVAKGTSDGVWFFEADDAKVFERITADTGHDLISEVPTYLVRSRAGRGHIYFRNTPAALAMGNLSQSYVKHGDFSVRVQNQYVVAAGSIHPHSKEPYVCLTPGRQPAPAPQWLIDWLLAQKTEKIPAKTGDFPQDAAGLIPHGYIHGWLVTQAGKLRGIGLGGAILENALIEVAHKNCAPPLDDEKIKQVARSFEKYEPNPVADIILNQKPDIEIPTVTDEIEIPDFGDGTYPVFPKYVWAGTSIYENFVKPVCDQNSRIDYFMWLPATAMLLNFLGTKIKTQIKGFGVGPFIGSIYMVLIGKRGETHKSYSVDDAMEYFKYIGCLAHSGRETKTAEGRSLVFTPGSPEGLGVEMQKTNCTNAIIYYDELSQLTKKAGIDGSALSSNLLVLYESKKFGNLVKTGKEAYSLEPSSYCASMIACCTDETFQDLWSKMSGADTGLDDRMMFVFQPEQLPEQRLKATTDFLSNSAITRQRIDRAIQKGTFELENINNPNLQQLVAKGSRYTDRAIKWALAIAVDLGLDSIDDECVDRGCDIVKYEIAVKKFLQTYDANSREAALQMRIRAKLEMHKGRLPTRELMRLCHADREGTTAWNTAFYGLVKAGIIRQEGAGKKSDPYYTQVLIKRDVEDL